MSGVWRLTVRSAFSAAHALRHYRGKCENTHGHNFAVEVTVEGKKLDDKTGMLVDFGVLKQALATVLAPLDHANLNETPPFDAISPSSENLASYIGRQMERALTLCPEGARARVASVGVSEKSTQTAVWVPSAPDREAPYAENILHPEVKIC